MPRKPWLKKLIYFEYETPANEKISLSDQDLFDQLVGTKSSSLFLGRFTVMQLEEFFEQVGISAKLKEKGVWPIKIRISCPEQFNYYLKVTLESGEIVSELFIREGHFTPRRQHIPEIKIGPMNLLFVEWLCIQNPFEKFSIDRLPLPGQRFPGLGVGRNVADLLERACRRTGRDGLLNFPEFYHNAYLYMERYHFYNPKKEAEVLAIKRDLENLSLVEVAWAVFSECVYNIDGKVYRWRPEALMWPCCKDLAGYFESDGWKEKARDGYETSKFTVNRDKLSKTLERLKDEVSGDRYTPAV